MKSEKSKRLLAFVLCMVLMLTTSMSTMAEGGVASESLSESMASQEPETQSTETTTTEETQLEEEIKDDLNTTSEEAPAEKEAETVAEEAVSKEGVKSEATEIKHEFQDENGNVLTTVIASFPEGAFEALTSDIVMEVKELNSETQEHVKELITKNLSETEKLGNFQLYEINFKVNGEKQNPKKPVTITIEENNTKIQATDAKKVNVFYLEKATEENKKESDEILDITAKTDLEEALKAEEKSTDNLDEYVYSDVSLNAEANAVNKVMLKAEKSGVYGCYVKEDAEGKTEDEKTVEEIEEEIKEEIKEEVKEETKIEEKAKSETETKESKAKLTYEDEDVTINVTEEKEGAIPEGTTLSVTPIKKDTKEYTAVEEKLNEKAEDEEYSIAGFLAYDITLVDKDGKKLEPDGNVKVTMDYKKGVLPEGVDTESEDLDVTVIHLEEDKNGKVKQVVDMVADEKEEASVQTTDETKVTKAEFVTDSFSDYAIAWYASNAHYDQTSGLNTVDTVDHISDGITMRMIDMDGSDTPNFRIKKSGSDTWTDLGGGYFAGNWVQNGRGYTWNNNIKLGGSIKKGLLNSVLGVDGYPTTTGTNTCVTGTNSSGSAITGTANQSLSALFSGGTEVNHLFRKDIYDNTGYYEYSSFENYAYLGNDKNFTVYDALGTPSEKNEFFYKRGNFMPYNRIYSWNKSQHTNQYDENGNVLSSTDSKKGKTLYKTDGTNYFFGMYMGADFLQPKDGMVKSPKDGSSNPMVYEFNGDDDLWIFIDGVLVLDIGGVHDAHSGSINFKTGEVSWYDCIKGNSPKQYKTTIKKLFKEAGKLPNGKDWSDSEAEKFFDGDTFADYTSHSFKMFYMERGAGASNLHMKFNLQVIPDGQIEVRKELENTDKEKYSNVKFAFQVYAQKKTGEDAQGNEIYGDEYELLNDATYKGTKNKVTFGEATFGDKTYKNVFYLKPDESAIFSGLQANRKYYVVELGVRSEEYDKVIINGIECQAYTDDNQLSGIFSYQTDEAEVANRPYVLYKNNCSAYNSRELRVTKQMKAGQTTNDTFSFKIQLSNDAEKGKQSLVPYANGNYYLKDANGNYYYYNNGSLQSNGNKSIVCGTTDANGIVTGVPAGYTVVITQILSGTSFKVEEVNLDSNNYLTPVKTIAEGTFDTSDVTGADGAIKLGADVQVTVTNSKPVNTLNIRKVDADNQNPLSGATFKLQKWDGSQFEDVLDEKGEIWTVTTDANGNATFDNLEKGKYQVTEISASDGYVLDESQKSFTIDLPYSGSNDNTITVNENNKLGDFYLEVTKMVTNQRKTWQIIKRSSSSNDLYLENAEFQLATAEDLSGTIYHGKSDANGKLVWYTDAEYQNPIDETQIAAGTYTLTETKAPAGYVKSTEQWNITIGQNGAWVNGTGMKDRNKSETNNQITCYFENTAVYELPSTGGSGVYRYTIGGALLMMAAALILYKNKSKEVLEK